MNDKATDLLNTALQRIRRGVAGRSAMFVAKPPVSMAGNLRQTLRFRMVFRYECRHLAQQFGSKYPVPDSVIVKKPVRQNDSV
jgi:hypothetical protein